jgi:hypothetical protein
MTSATSPPAFAAAQRARGLKLLTWTVRSGDQEKVALACADEMIYERPGARADDPQRARGRQFCGD